MGTVSFRKLFCEAQFHSSSHFCSSDGRDQYILKTKPVRILSRTSNLWFSKCVQFSMLSGAKPSLKMGRYSMKKCFYRSKKIFSPESRISKLPRIEQSRNYRNILRQQSTRIFSQVSKTSLVLMACRGKCLKTHEESTDIAFLQAIIIVRYYE